MIFIIETYNIKTIIRKKEPIVLIWSDIKNMKINKLRMTDIKKTLNYHHIFYEKKHKKLDLHFILVNYFKTIEYYTKNINKLRKVQKFYKHKYKDFVNSLQGPLTLNPELITKCVNDEDLFTCEEIKDIVLILF